VPKEDQMAANGAERQTRGATPAPEPKLLSIEELARRHKLEAWELAGLKAAFRWGAGKELTEEEFLAARREWLGGPMVRRSK
jgi:hypothetical protein